MYLSEHKSPSVRTEGRAPAGPTAEWPQHTGVAGISLRGARPSDRPDPAAALARLAEWTAGLETDGERGSPESFPFKEILDHFQTTGRNYASPELVDALRGLERRLAETALPDHRLPPDRRLLLDWLPSTFDQDDGDYDSYLLVPMLERLAAADGESQTDPGLDTQIRVLLADLLLAESEALAVTPDAHWQRVRTHAVAQALARVAELAPGARGGVVPPARFVRTLDRDDPALAALGRRLAQAALDATPEAVRQAAEISMLPSTPVHDELMFVRSVQLFELVYRRTYRCLERALTALRAADLSTAVAELEAAAERVESTPILYRVLTTMSREGFAIIRAHTEGRSAIQSRAYRQVERITAPRPRTATDDKVARVEVPSPTLQEVFQELAPVLGEPALEPVAAAMARLDDSWRAMKRTHWGITRKIIKDSPGTGGTTGADYLKATAAIPLFPDLRGAGERTRDHDRRPPRPTENTMPDPEDQNSLLRRKIMGYIVSQAIFAVTELKVVESLGEEAVPAAELARRVGADPDALHRFLRVLTAEGLFVEQPAGTFAVTPLGALLHRDAPGSLHHLASLMAGEAYQAWTAAGHSLRTGRAAFDTVFGKPMFDWLGDHPAELAAFNEGQAGLVTLRLLPLLDRDWSGVGTVVDVGGGNGTLLGTLLSRHRELRGVLFDLPKVADEALSGLGGGELRERCRVVGGDFFDEVPSGGDVYVLAQILHDWSDDRAVEILRSCHRAMGPGARLLILEQVIPDDSRPHPAKLLDLHMLVLLGGRERSESSWRRLLTESGFEFVGIDRSARSSLIEARPAEVPAVVGAAARHDEPGGGNGSAAGA